MNFGILGCGMIAHFHARALANMNRAKLKAVADISYESAVRFGQCYGIRTFASYEAMLESPDIDAVCICTPSGFHAAQAVMALEHGKHVVVEKPLALNRADADLVLAACRRSDKLLTVISQNRFLPDIVRVKELLSRNALGKIVTVDLAMMYSRKPEYYQGSSWKGTKEIDGGELMNQGIHGVDLLRYLAGPVVRTYGLTKTLYHRIPAEDTAAAVLEFSNGALGTVISTTAATPGYHRKLTICGTEGSVVINGETIERLDTPQEHIRNLEQTDTRDVSNPADMDISGHVRQLENFVAAVEKREPLLIDAREHCETLQIIWSVYEGTVTKNGEGM